jgi:hypothetical protein
MDAISRASVVLDVFRGRPGSFNQQRQSFGRGTPSHLKPVRVLDESRNPAAHVRFLILGPRLPERLTALLLLIVAFDALASNAVGEMVCGDVPVTVIGWTREDAIEVCSAVQASLSWLRTTELTLSDSVTIRPLDDQGALANTHRLGRYDARTKEIQILPFDAALKASVAERPAFGVPMTRDLWRSYVAHEMAHAVADAYFPSGVSHLTAGEYIAGVLQLVVLPDGPREEVLENYRKLAGWESASEISAQYYLMAPGAFAIKSYKHFTALTPSEQRRFITRLTRERLSD